MVIGQGTNERYSVRFARQDEFISLRIFYGKDELTEMPNFTNEINRQIEQRAHFVDF